MLDVCLGSRMVRRMTALSVLLLLCTGAASKAQDAEEAEKARAQIRAQYTKYEYRVPMRDGAKLFTVVYVPKDAGPAIAARWR